MSVAISAMMKNTGDDRTDGLVPVVLVAGPTASGKSGLGLCLADALNGVVINADSMQVYRDLAVITARPDAASCARVPHRLYGYAAADHSVSVASWLEKALHEIAAADAAERLPVIVGGSGLYLEALLYGLAYIPDVPPAVHEDAQARMSAMGRDTFHDWLATVDPDVVGRLDRGDTQRLLRAAGVWLATGRSLSSWQAAGRKAPTICGRRLAPVTLLLSPERSVLYAAIEQRFDAMMAGGGLAEVQRLAHLGLDRRRPVMRALGVPQLLDHLQGHMPLHQAVAEAKTLSRRYAKRQITWFRHRYPVANFTPITQLSESFIEEIISEIRKLELTPSSAATSFSLPSG